MPLMQTKRTLRRIRGSIHKEIRVECEARCRFLLAATKRRDNLGATRTRTCWRSCFHSRLHAPSRLGFCATSRICFKFNAATEVPVIVDEVARGEGKLEAERFPLRRRPWR